MFGLFKKKDQSPKPQYKFFVSEVEKYRFLAKAMMEAGNEKFVLVYHFDNTRSETEQLLKAANVPFSTDRNGGERILLLNAQEFIEHEIYGMPTVYVIEIYPLADRDVSILEKSNEKGLDLTFYAALDSPFFKIFAGDRLLNLLEKMGVDPAEILEHNMISSSVQKAQAKIASQVGTEQTTNDSIEEWIKMNKVQF